jgi:transcriptional regulator with XRE-family HTH domain
VILRRDSSPRRVVIPVEPTSVPDLARTLRQVRLQRGLDLEEAAAACGLPVGQLEDFEAGTVSRLPDRVAVLKALRRYADSLDLPGERFVLVMVEHWPEEAMVTAAAVATGTAVEAVAGAPSLVPAAPVAETSTLFLVPDTLTTATVVAQPSPAVVSAGAGANGATDVDPSTDQGPLVLADTGVTPAVRAWRPRAGALGDSAVLEYVNGFLAVVLVICAAWLAVNHWRPQWLRTIHVPYTSKSLPLVAGTPAAATPGTHPSTATRGTTATTAKSAAPTTTAPAAPRGRGGSTQALRLTSVTGDHATFAVRADTFVVRVHCVGGDAWVQVSGSTPTPVFAQVVPTNGTKNFRGQGQLTMVIGSSAARLTVLHDKKVIGTYTPPSAPFSMTFNSTG